MSSINRNIPTYFKVDVVNNTKAKFKSITKKQNKLPIVIETTLSGTLEEQKYSFNTKLKEKNVYINKTTALIKF